MTDKGLAEAMDKRFDVVICDMENKVVSIIGKNLTESQAERRIMTGLIRINDRHFVTDVPTGTAEIGKVRFGIKP